MSGRPYHNVFVSYRGPSKLESQAQVDQQLEDNATKALINVLELAPKGAGLAHRFVRRFVSEALNPTGSPAFYLQPRLAVLSPERFLLGVSSSGRMPDAEPSPISGAGRADAAIVFPDELVVAVEVKVGEGELHRAQMERHAANWGVAGETDWRVCRWKAIYQWVHEELGAAKDPVTRFLLEQLREFLATAGLAPFLGLEEPDFTFFATANAERDALHQPVIRARLSALTEELVTALPDEVRTRLVTPRVQPIRLDDNAGSIVWQGPKTDVNLTVELGPRDLQLNLVGWNDDQAAKLEAWLRSEAARVWLHDHPDFELVSYRRWARNQFTRAGVDYPIWQSQNSTEIDERIPARSFTTEKLDAVLAQIGDPKWNKKGFHLRRPWPKQKTIALGDQIVQEVAGAIGELEELSTAING